ncbi:MAG: protein TolQ [Acidobacteria bacterium]|nr:protein TolQ [Acidobacteriota bacterium]
MSDGVFGLIGDLGPLAQVALVVLALFSVFSWSVIVDRLLLFRKAVREGEEFTEAFHTSSKFSELRKAAESRETTPLGRIFMAGYGEISAQFEGNDQSSRQVLMEPLERTLRRAANAERRRLERGMLFLATTSTATPFIGLFGTVWGIMNAFQEIGALRSADLAVVAPGISEALLTTAGGLFAAIPAVIAYNHLNGRIRGLATDMEDFGMEFMNVVQKTWRGGSNS